MVWYFCREKKSTIAQISLVEAWYYRLTLCTYTGSGYRARFTRFNHRMRVLPRAAGKTWTSVYCTSGSSGFIGYRETGALITFVFQGVQTRGWIHAIHHGRVQNEQTLQLASKLRSLLSFYFRGRLSLTLLRVSR